LAVFKTILLTSYRSAYSILIGKPEGNRPIGSPSSRWEDNVKVDLRVFELDFSGSG
jgi:hypothetical protein